MPDLQRIHEFENVALTAEAELAQTWLTIGELLSLTPGAFLPLESAGPEMTLRVGGALLGWGETAGDGSGLRITRFAKDPRG
jgi:flagellar motor switch/type III secretory pathway protein FliN